MSMDEEIISDNEHLVKTEHMEEDLELQNPPLEQKVYMFFI